MDIKRDKYLNDLINRMHNGIIKVVTGIRRCGKKVGEDHVWEEGTEFFNIHII